jgi:hypothetical protein
MYRFSRAFSLPLYQAAVGYAFAALALGVMLRIAGEAARETLPGYGDVVATSDSGAVVAAAVDALRGASSVLVPMRATRYRREGRDAVVSLRPVPTPGVAWRGLGGTVRILPDGRRVIVARE